MLWRRCHWTHPIGCEGSEGSEGKVLKMDRPLAGGFLSLTGLWPEGCGIALSGDEYKVSVTGLAFCVIWHDKHYVDQPPPVAFPPLVPYGTTFPPRWEACHLILSRLRLPANQVPLPPRSGQGGSHYPSGARLACFPSPARAVVKVLIYDGAEGAVPPQWNGTSYLPRAEPSTRL